MIETVAARGSVASGANVRPATASPPCPRSQLTRKCGELPSVRMRRSPGRIWIWCILNVTEHLWWTDIKSCKAFKWPYTGRKFFVFLEMPPPGKCRRGRLLPPPSPPPFVPPLPAPLGRKRGQVQNGYIEVRGWWSGVLLVEPLRSYIDNVSLSWLLQLQSRVSDHRSDSNDDSVECGTLWRPLQRHEGAYRLVFRFQSRICVFAVAAAFRS